MARTQISGDQIKNSSIATVKLSEGSEFLRRDGTVLPSADFDVNDNKIVNLAAPTNPNDAARLVDLQSMSAGLDPKESCRVATTVNVSISTGLESGDVIDGITLATGDRILVKDQTDASENGIYVVQASGAAVRSTDADDGTKVTSGLYVLIEVGSVNSATGWVLITQGTIVLDTTDLSFTKFSSTSSHTAGDGIDINTGIISVDLDTSSGLEFNTGKLRVSPVVVRTDFSVVGESPSGTINGSNTVFTLSLTPYEPSKVQLFQNGLLLEQGGENDYTISGTTITMIVAPLMTDKLKANYLAEQ